MEVMLLQCRSCMLCQTNPLVVSMCYYCVILCCELCVHVYMCLQQKDGPTVLEERDTSSKWNVLRSDFMLGASMKDWDRQLEGEEEEEEQQEEQLNQWLSCDCHVIDGTFCSCSNPAMGLHISVETTHPCTCNTPSPVQLVRASMTA